MSHWAHETIENELRISALRAKAEYEQSSGPDRDAAKLRWVAALKELNAIIAPR